MRETPNQDNLEAWCIELTLGGSVTDYAPGELLERAKLYERESRRALRVAVKTPITKASKRHRRYLAAAAAKTRGVYVGLLAQAVHSRDVDVAGDLTYAEAHQARASANAFGENWLARQVAH